MKKDKLYTVSKYSADRINEKAKANLYAYAGPLYTVNPNIVYNPYVGNSGIVNPSISINPFLNQQEAQLDKQAGFSEDEKPHIPYSEEQLGIDLSKNRVYPNPPSKWKSFNTSGWEKSPLWGVAGSVGNVVISGGYSDDKGIGNILTQTGSAIPGPYGFLVSTLGGAYNRLAGVKRNNKNIATIKNNVGELKSSANELAAATSTNSLVQASNNSRTGSGFSRKDLIKGGPFSNAGKEANKYLTAEQAALARLNHSMVVGAKNVDKIQDNNVMANFAAGGGWLNYGDMGALEYGLLSDYNNRKLLEAQAKNKIPSNPFGALAVSPFNGYVDGGILFRDGGPLIKEENKGKFTAQAKAAGMGTQQFASHVLANKEDYSPTTVKRANFAHVFGGRNYNYGGPLFNDENLFDIGGVLQSHGSDWSNGSSHIDEGGTHEENPYQGVQVGVDPEGTPNLVEEGEIIYNDYVYSQRIELDDEAKEKFHFSKKRDITYADAAKKLEKEISERPNDPLSRAAFKSQMADLADEQERQKAEMQAEEAREQFESLSPEEQVAIMQNAEAQEQQAAEEEAMMQEQAAQEQAMQEQAAMQGQPTEEQMMQEQMMAQQQGMIPQQPMGLEAQMGGYAYGGLMGNQYGLGGNLFFDGGDKEQDSDLSKAFFDRALDKWEKDNGRKASDTAKAALWKIAKANRKRFSKKPFGSKNEYWDINRLIKSLTANSLGEYEGDAYAKYKVFRDAGATEDDYYFLYPYQYVGTSAEKRYKDRNDAYKYLWETRLNKTYAPKNSIPDVIVTGKKGNKQPNNSEQKTGETVVPVNNSSAQTESVKNSSQKDTVQQIFSYLKGVLTPEQYERVRTSKKAKDAIAAHIRSGKSAEQFISDYNKRIAAKKGQPTVNDAVAAASEASGTLTLTPEDIQGTYMQGYSSAAGNTGNYVPNYGPSFTGPSQVSSGGQPMQQMPPVYTTATGQQVVYTPQGMIPAETYMAMREAAQERTAAQSMVQPVEQIPTIAPYDENTIKNRLLRAIGANTWSDFVNWAKDNKIADADFLNSQKPDTFDWEEIINNEDLRTALKEKDPYLADVLSRGYDFGKYRPSADDALTFKSIDRGNWEAQDYAGWNGSEDPAWLEAVEKGLVKEGMNSQQIGEALKQTSAFQRGTKWLQDSEDNRLRYLRTLLTDKNTPDVAKNYARKFIDDNGWLKDAPRDYVSIFGTNGKGVRETNPGTYWHTPTEAIADAKVLNLIRNNNGDWEEIIGDISPDWKKSVSYNWNVAGDKDAGTSYINNIVNYYDTPEQIAAAKTKTGAAKAGDAAEKEEPARDVVPVTRSEWPRYAGLFGPAVGLGMMAAGIGKPSLKDYEAALEIANGGASLASYMPIGNYLKYQPMDIWAQQNRMDANSRATDRAILNNASPVGTRNAGLLANSYNSQLGSGELYRNALQYNDQLMQGVGTFNRATDMFNAEAFNRASATNAEIRNRDRQLRAQIGLQTAAEKAAANAGWYNSLYGNVAGLFKGFSDLGRENAQRNMIAKLAAAGAFGTLTPENAVGAGLVQWKDEADKKKKRNWLSIFG